MKLIRNRIKCLNCDTIIESKHRHDFVTCNCGDLSVDGGLEYSRLVYKDLDNMEGLKHQDLCEYEPDEAA